MSVSSSSVPSMKQGVCRMKILIANCNIPDRALACGYRNGVDICIEGQRISSVTPHREFDPEGFDEVIDGRNRLVIPGLVNAHSHSPETLGRASHDRLPLEPWLVYMMNAMGRYTPREHYLAAMLGAIETLKSGATSILDHLTLPGGWTNEVLDAVMQAYQDVGIRANVAPLFPDPTGIIEQNEMARRFEAKVIGAEDVVLPTIKEQEAIFRSFHKSWEGQGDGRLHTCIGPGGIQWVSAPYLHFVMDLASELDMGVHSHLMETRVQDQTARSLFNGRTAVEFLVDERLMSPRLSLPHSIWLTDKDVRLIAEHGAVPVHNPAANMRLGSGFSPICKFWEAGCIPALGANGSMSSDHQNMMVVMHLAAQIHNCTYDNPQKWVSSVEVFDMATLGGARAMRLEGSIGKIQSGYLADLSILNLDSPAMCPMNNAFHSLCYTAPSSSVTYVIVNGNFAVRGGVVLGVDEKAIYAECREAVLHHNFAGVLPQAVENEVKSMLESRNDLYISTTFENRT